MNRPPPIRRLLDLDLLACLSASNLVFVQTWTLLDVRPAGGELYYYSLPTPSHLGALWLVMLLLGVALRLLVAGCRTGRPWLAVPSRLALLAAALVVFNILRHYLQATVDVDLFGPLRFKATAGFEWMAVAALGVTLAMLVRRAGHRFAEVFCGLFLIASPNLLWSAYFTGREFARGDFAVARQARPVVPPVSRTGPPVRVHIFDEWDYSQTFDAPRSPLPELLRLRETSLWADQEQPWARDTDLVIPTYLTGFPTGRASHDANGSVLTSIDGREHRRLEDQPNVFASARERGYTTAILGYHHPYCRLFAAEVASCREYRYQEFQDFSLAPGPWVLGQLPFSGVNAPSRSDADKIYSRAIDEYLAMLSGGNYDFVYAHWPFPHRPFVKADGSDGDYGDNLELTDRVVGKVRRTLEAKGVWDESLVIITSDHWWRDSGSDDRRIPFFVKLPWQTTSYHYQRPFNGIGFYTILDAALAGQLRSQADLVALLDQMTTTGKAPAP